MRYLIVRRKGFVLQMRGDSSQPDFPYHLSTEELSQSDAREQAAADDIKEVIPVIEFQKLKPASIHIDPRDHRAVVNGVTWGVRAVEALRAGNNGETVTVAVLDTGIDRQHPAFSGLDLTLNDFTSDESGVPGMAEDRDGHGTHVAATIFGRDVDGIRIGVAPGITKALIGKVISDRGASLVALKSSLDWAINKRADIICLSLGVDFLGLVERFEHEFQIPRDIAMSRVLESYRKTMNLFETYAASVKAYAAYKRGALLVAATGNGSRREENPDYTVNAAPPAAGDGFVSVGAVMPHGQTVDIAPFSNTNPHLVAPGVSILSAGLGGGLASNSGTSMAAPHVAGVAALWIAHLFPKGDRPAGWTDRVRSTLHASARQVAASFADVGHGLVQAPPS